MFGSFNKLLSLNVYSFFSFYKKSTPFVLTNSKQKTFQIIFLNFIGNDAWDMQNASHYLQNL